MGWRSADEQGAHAQNRGSRVLPDRSPFRPPPPARCAGRSNRVGQSRRTGRLPLAPPNALERAVTWDNGNGDAGDDRREKKADGCRAHPWEAWTDGSPSAMTGDAAHAPAALTKDARAEPKTDDDGGLPNSVLDRDRRARDGARGARRARRPLLRASHPHPKR